MLTRPSAALNIGHSGADGHFFAVGGCQGDSEWISLGSEGGGGQLAYTQSMCDTVISNTSFCLHKREWG